MNCNLSWCLTCVCFVFGGVGCAAEPAPCPTFEGRSYTLTVLSSDDACDLGFESLTGTIIDVGPSERCAGTVQQTGCHVELLDSACDQPNGDTIVQNIVLDFDGNAGTFDGTIGVELFTPEGVSQCEGSYEVSYDPAI